MHDRRRLASLLLAGVLLSMGLVVTAARTRDSSAATTLLTGAGSTFDQPFFNVAFPVYQANAAVKISYSGVGSGRGIAAFIANSVDFGASDVPMDGAEQAAAARTGSAVVQIPVVLGAVAIAYHLPRLGNHALRLDGMTLARIFMGMITRWNDPAIKHLNLDLHLPASPIVLVHRADASGTTYITTDFLSAVDAAWQSAIGKGKTVRWPAGSLAGTGNPGVATLIKAHIGAIGYVQMDYAVQNNIPYAAILNRAGSFTFATPSSVAAAAAQFPQVTAQDFSIVDAPGFNSYPIAGYSWVLLRQHPRRAATALVKLFRWTVTSGQQYAAQVRDVPLPDNVQHVALTGLDTVK